MSALPYIPGTTALSPRPLARYLPPLNHGVITHWLHSNVPKGAWIIDPFGASPRLVIEAAQAGYRVLAAVNNPVARFLLEIAANRPSQVELRAALSELASAHRGGERLEPHIRSVYQTTCAACGQSIMAEAFLWDRGANAPYARIYKCPYCQDEGEHPVNESDIHLATQFAGSGLHRARALEQVTLPNDPDRIYVEEALSHYLPRAVYVLFTLFNRLDGLEISATRRRYLQALLLHACDMGNTLWAIPTSRPRPRLLATPPRFRENNIWLALEHAIEICGEQASPVNIPLMYWPEKPPVEGGICLFEHRLRDLASSIKEQPFEAVITAIPRHNQAFWTLSALWAGWLWGREAVGPFKAVLRRRWYDWAWHTSALYIALQYLATMLKPKTPFFGILSEAEPGFLTAALTAADAAGFALESLSLHEDDAQAQILWRQNIQPHKAIPKQSTESIVTRSIQAYLTKRAEPASYLFSLTAGLQGLAEQRIPFQEMNPCSNITEIVELSEEETAKESDEPTTHPRPHHLYTSANAVIRKALTNRSLFTNFNISDRTGTAEVAEKGHAPEPESGLYWLYDGIRTNLSLSDRVEIAIVRYLTTHPTCSYLEIQDSIFEAFPGLLTPDDDLIQACLESYAELEPTNERLWHLHAQDQPTQRRKDISEVIEMLKKVGERLGFLVLQENVGPAHDHLTVGWLNAFKQSVYWFYPIASAVLSAIILERDQNKDGEHVLVIPGSRANLLLLKLRRDPHLAQAFKPVGDWRFLKFRHLRWILENPLLTSESLAESLDLDPLTYSTPQLRLI